VPVNHLGLPVRDYQRSLRFYTAYFGFDPATAQEYPDGTVIVRNADGFDLALLARLEADGVTIVERDDKDAYASFKCLDPDGHRVEVYWEPVAVGGS
jgi:catechol 2,3-dioxygenase-like lactoylglutathione lyase family enzyme